VIQALPGERQCPDEFFVDQELVAIGGGWELRPLDGAA
jgi:hypothetical protein